MSAFVVNLETMHRAVAAMDKGKLPCAELDALGSRLYALNLEAVCQRYPDCRANPDNMPGPIPTPSPEAYRYDPMIVGNPHRGTALTKAVQRRRRTGNRPVSRDGRAACRVGRRNRLQPARVGRGRLGLTPSPPGRGRSRPRHPTTWPPRRILPAGGASNTVAT